jgi:uncharacterized protein YqhQ
VRTPKGKIVVRTREYHSITETNKFLGLPFIRGIISLVEVISLGIKEMSWATSKTSPEQEKLTKKEITVAIILSVAIALIIFKLIPWTLANLLSKALGTNFFMLNLIDAFLKIIILILYFSLLGVSKDVKLLFKYHGAEHKTVSCFESGKKLTPLNASTFSRIHPRCGTTFIFIVFITGLLFYLFIPLQTGFWLNYAIRIALLPIIAGVAYELIRLEGKYYNNKIVKAIIWPGLQFQRLTTNNPTKKHLEVAIASLDACIKKETQRSKR